MLDDLMGYLKNLREKLCEKCPKADKTEVTTLSTDDMREWAVIKTEEGTLKKELDKLAQRQNMLSARREILMGKIRLKHDELKSKLIIEKGKVFRIECTDECPSSGMMPGMPGMLDMPDIPGL